MTLSPISTLSTAAYNTASAAVNAVRNNPKTTTAVVLTAAATYYNADAITAFVYQTLPVVREYAEHFGFIMALPPEIVVESVLPEAILDFSTHTLY